MLIYSYLWLALEMTRMSIRTDDTLLSIYRIASLPCFSSNLGYPFMSLLVIYESDPIVFIARCRRRFILFEMFHASDSEKLTFRTEAEIIPSTVGR